MTQQDCHTQYMNYAITLAKGGIGCVAPNPSVGCVIVNKGIIVGVGRTQNCGRPHAEFVALQMAGDKACGAQAYVTLEPCAHEDTTPSCAKLLIKAGIKTCYIATLDPDVRTKGKGVALLQKANIEVFLNILREKAEAVNKGFFSRILQNRPTFTLKLAVSMDGKIALKNGISKWITSERARQYGHLLRASNDAILIGKNTLYKDRPKLTCHLLQGVEKQNPIPIVLSNTSIHASFFPSHKHVHIFSGVAKDVAKSIAKQGINTVLIEGGATTSTHFLQAGLVDYIALFHTTKILGDDALSCFTHLGLNTIDQCPQYIPVQRRYFDIDTFTLLKKA